MTAQVRRYGVAIRLEGGNHHVYVRDLPEVVTAGDTHAEALELAKDAIAVAVAGRREDGMALPEPSPVAEHELAVDVLA